MRGAVRGLMMAGGLVGLAVGTAAWAPWQSSPPGEGGTGHAVVPVASRPVPTTIAAPAGGSAAAVAPPPPAPVAAAPASAWIATLHGPAPYSARPGGPVVGTMPATNPFGQVETLAVIGQPDGSGWVHVELPIRPDGSSGWIPTGAVSFTTTPYRIDISVAAHTLTVRDGSQVVVTVPAAVGAPRTPTPAGQTYVWELIRPDNPSGAYGPYILGLAMFSNAYSVFNGGDAQIGIHGNDEPWSIGHPVSHGCVRLTNDVITRLAGLLPLGTPVTIV